MELLICFYACDERWGAGVETHKNVREEVGGWGRVPFNEELLFCVCGELLCNTLQYTATHCNTLSTKQLMRSYCFVESFYAKRERREKEMARAPCAREKYMCMCVCTLCG